MSPKAAPKKRGRRQADKIASELPEAQLIWTLCVAIAFVIVALYEAGSTNAPNTERSPQMIRTPALR